MGEDEDGNLGFLTNDKIDPEGSVVVQKVHAYSAKTLTVIANQMEEFIPQFEEYLELQPLRQRRRGQSLELRRKGQPRAKRGVKRKHPPRS
jgi:hypothetical protein